MDERLRAAKDVEWKPDETEEHYLMRVRGAEQRAEDRQLSKDYEKESRR